MSSLLEIVELANGEIVLKSADDDRPLINIRFGSPSDLLSASDRLEVARAMIQAGMASFAEIVDSREMEENQQATDECFETGDIEIVCDTVLH